MLYKCKDCGGELAFDPTSGKLKCKFCDRLYDVSEYEDDSDHLNNQPQDAQKSGFDKTTDGTTAEKEDMVVYQCPHCGAEVVTDKTTAATSCIFCDTPLVIQEQVTGKFTPEFIIPFEKDKKEVGEIYEKYIRSRPFHRKEFSFRNVIDQIRPVYLPYWIYDIRIDGSISGTGEITRTMTTPDYIVTTHNVFAFQREGNMGFERIPVIASSRTPRSSVEAIEPYNYENLKEFNSGYLPGFIAERYDKDTLICQSVAGDRAKETIQNELLKTAIFENVHVQHAQLDAQAQKTAYILLPVYLVHVNYGEGEDSWVTINGQTGKIAGNIPASPWKLVLCGIVIFLIVFLIAFILLYNFLF